jgi:hypothetical protein
MKASAERDAAERDAERSVSDVDEPLVELDETIDLAAPMRHFQHALIGRSLSSGPLANPLRTRLG